MKKILLLISGTLLCVSCTTRPPLLSERGPSISADGRPIVPVTFVFTTNTPQATKFDNYQQMRKEIKILNKYYVDDKIIRFSNLNYTVISLMKSSQSYIVI
ncbi:hypothetical protein BANRA_02201 [Acinetobacter baumannii]|nr:hypothetical protein BANRA_03708 [Acinetobacter baumannii]VCX46694.1 hypothetical protein BANRA_02234 [Acinetobacter baumannii]VCX74416.1 hypothetical protein BANRA_00374 [Acinetobacter baumannii]VCZ54695.1 hypothetical protein BANRA_01664 [Acinetobacter baumannii]VDA15754.1 hypothetical protein BANRA_02201 [Acinetobacter baumannii]